MIILDTHAWVWWCARRSALSARARDAIEGSRQVGVAAISCWEVAMLVERGRLAFDRDVLAWIRQALAPAATTCLPLLPEIAVAAASGPLASLADPADRMIVATARHLHAPLVTKDARMRRMKDVETVW